MPLVETLTLLASLGSALQTLRLPKNDDKPPDRNETSATLLLSYEYVRTSQDATVRADEAVTGRMHLLTLVAGATLAGACALIGDVSAGDPLLIAALVLLGVIAVVMAIASVALRPSLIATEDVLARQAVLGEAEFLRDAVQRAGRLESANRRMLAIKGGLLALLYLAFAAQVMLLGVWAAEA